MTTHWWHRAGHDAETGFMLMLGCSALVHTVLIGFFLFSMSAPSPKLTFGPVHTVQLVSIADQMFKGTASSSISRDILLPQAGPPAVVLRKPLETMPAVPQRQTDLPKTTPSAMEKALEAIRTRLQETPSTPPASVSRTARPDREAGSPEAAGSMDPYYAEIWSRIRGMWSMPQGMLPSGNVEAVINAKIMRNGAVVNISFEKKSGNIHFDESAIRALKKASPLPPLPSWIRGESIEIGIRFRSGDLP